LNISGLFYKDIVYSKDLTKSDYTDITSYKAY